MGNRAAGMFNHKDTLQTSSWQLQIQGRKLWHLCPPSEDGKMYAAGAVNAFAPDYDRYPHAEVLEQWARAVSSEIDFEIDAVCDLSVSGIRCLETRGATSKSWSPAKCSSIPESTGTKR